MSDNAWDDSNDPERKTASLQGSTSITRQLKRGRPRGQPLLQDSTWSAGNQGSSPSSSASSVPTRTSSEVPSSSTDTEVASTSSMGLIAEERKLNSSARHMRNLAEKMRRDKLNTYVSELAAIVPPVADSSKKVDKTSVLRLAANFIRMHNMLGADGPTERLPFEAERGLMETLDDKFLLVVTNTGKIVFVSDAIEQIFGYGQMELLGRSLYSFVHPDDCDLLGTQLIPSDTDRRSFFCRFAEKSLSRTDAPNYDIIHVQGALRKVPQPSSEQHIVKQEMSTEDTLPPVRHRRSTRHYGSLHISEDSSGSEEFEEGRALRNKDSHLLVALLHLIKERPLTELSRVESLRDEYITRHDACGTIMYTDHRISYVTGYMPESVFGASAFMYMHLNDLLWSMVAQKQMLGTEHGQGVVTYRLRCQDNSYVTLRSRGYLEFNKKTGQFESFVCINSVVDEKHSEEEIRKQRRHLLPVIVGNTADDLLTKLKPQFPVEIMQMVQKTLGERSIKRLLAVMSKLTDKEPSSRDSVLPATITEIHEDTPVHSKEKVPQHACEDESSKLRSPGGDSLRCKSKKKRWVTLNKGSSFGPDCGGRNRDSGNRMRRDTLKRHLLKDSVQSSGLDSEGVYRLPTGHASPKQSEEHRSCSSKRARHTLSDEREERAAAGSSSWHENTFDSTNSSMDNVHIVEEPSLGHSNKLGDSFMSQQALLESDARRKKQMILMEQMTYNMELFHALKRQPSSPSVGLPEKTNEQQTGFNQQMETTHHPNMQPLDNVNQQFLSSSPYSQQQYSPLQVSNENKPFVDLPTINVTSTSFESQQSTSKALLAVRCSPPSLSEISTRPSSPQIFNCFNQAIGTVSESFTPTSPTADSLQSLNVANTGLGFCGTNFEPKSYFSAQSKHPSQGSSSPHQYSLDSSPAETLSSGLGTQSSRLSPFSPHSYTSCSPSTFTTSSPLVSPCAGGELGQFAGPRHQQLSQTDFQYEQQNQRGSHTENWERLYRSSSEQQSDTIAQEDLTTRQQEDMLSQHQGHNNLTRQNLDHPQR